jgi:DNA-3-methyladenine glycosylase
MCWARNAAINKLPMVSSLVCLIPISRRFYARHPTVVARQLLGKILVRRIGRKAITGRIVETEAYSSDDPASHAYRGRTENNRALFGEVGRAYIYLTHGLHYCLNVVAKSGKPAGGVLIRAIEPLQGIGLMMEFRPGSSARNLARGPGNLTRTLNINKDLYGKDLTKRGELYIADEGSENLKVAKTKRIGVTSAREKRWRYIIRDNPFVSKPTF